MDRHELLLFYVRIDWPINSYTHNDFEPHQSYSMYPRVVTFTLIG